MAEGTFVTILGSVEFDPSERQVQGKDVTDVTLRAVHNQKKYRVTFWPNLAEAAAKIKKGDLIAVTGKGSQNTVDGDDGPRTYNNVSAFGILNLGAFVMGEKPATDNAQTVADDDIPF